MGNLGHAPGRLLLEIDGVAAGYVRNFSGGGAHAEVITEAVGPGQPLRKHIGNVGFDDIVLSCDAGVSKALWDWVGKWTTQPGSRKDGAVVVVEGDQKTTRVEWRNGLITGVYFPALDAASKDWLAVDVKIAPELIRRGDGSGKPPAAVTRSQTSTGTFRLRIDGFEEACRHVTKIDRIALEGRTVKERAGSMREVEVVPTDPVDPGNLRITLPESSAKGFYDWANDFMIKGNSGQGSEKHGSLDVGPFSLAYSGLGLKAISSSKLAAATRSATIEFYAESVVFSASVGG